MTERTPPLYLQSGSHSAEEDRLGISSAYGKVSGVAGSTDLAVSANGTPNMSVNVAAGRAVIVGSESSLQGAYHVTNDAVKNLTISAANATNPRRDLIVAKVQDASYSGSTNSWSLAVVTGAAAPSPADPATPANSITLARVSVAANATSITSGNITDLRPRAASLGGIRVATSTTRPSSPTEGDFIWETDTDALKVYTTATTGWVPPWNLPWGVQAITTMPALSAASPQTGITTTATTLSWGSTTCAATATLVSNRRYRVVAVIPEVWSSVADDSVQVQILGPSSIIYNRQLIQLGKIGVAHSITCEATVSGLSGSSTFTAQILRADGTGTISIANSSLQSSTFIYIEDVGQTAAPA
jgi:hypothetical protein